MSVIYIVEPGGEQRTYTEKQVLSQWKQGGISEQALFWIDGMPDWRPIRELFKVETATGQPMVFVPARAPIPFAKDHTALTRFLKVMLWISLVLACFGVTLSTISIATGNANKPPEEDMSRIDLMQVLVGLSDVFANVITAVAFLMWTYRASHNARALGAEGMKFTPGWTVGWYFVPIFNLWKPYQAMKELWKASRNPYLWETERVPPLVGNWWALWLLATILGQLSFRMAFRTKTATDLLTSEVVSLCCDILDITLCVLAIRLVSSIYRMQVQASQR